VNEFYHLKGKNILNPLKSIFTVSESRRESEAELEYVEHLCRRVKIALSLVFLRR